MLNSLWAPDEYPGMKFRYYVYTGGTINFFPWASSLDEPDTKDCNRARVKKFVSCRDNHLTS